MIERIFTDNDGKKLIVRHRKFAVFFLREMDPRVKGYVYPHWIDQTPMIKTEDINIEYDFSQEVFSDFVDYMEKISLESWKVFTAKVADSFGSDYAEYYDRDFDNEGSLSVSGRRLRVRGPHQPKTDDFIIRIFKFNKRKFESFIFDLRDIVEKQSLQLEKDHHD